MELCSLVLTHRPAGGQRKGFKNSMILQEGRLRTRHFQSAFSQSSLRVSYGNIEDVGSITRYKVVNVEVEVELSRVESRESRKSQVQAQGMQAALAAKADDRGVMGPRQSQLSTSLLLVLILLRRSNPSRTQLCRYVFISYVSYHK